MNTGISSERQPTPIEAGQAARELAQRADLRLKSPGAEEMPKEITVIASAPAEFQHETEKTEL